MKRLLLTLAIMFSLTTVVNAQTGKIWVGGSTGLNTTKVKDGERLTNFNITPEIGYMVSDDLGVGIKFGYAHKEYEITDDKAKSNGFTLNPFARYSFLKGSIGGLFVDGGVGYTYSKVKTIDMKVRDFEVGLKPGVAINVSDKLALTGKFGFLGYQYEKFGDRKTNSFGFDFDLSQVQLGLNLIF
ncbi:MAG: outer membrane beta-barrel protein [Dysgonomonas sp.]|nr:outer membrane beta-barrel protein [Dysgonomonas sp.]